MSAATVSTPPATSVPVISSLPSKLTPQTFGLWLVSTVNLFLKRGIQLPIFLNKSAYELLGDILSSLGFKIIEVDPEEVKKARVYIYIHGKGENLVIKVVENGAKREFKCRADELINVLNQLAPPKQKKKKKKIYKAIIEDEKVAKAVLEKVMELANKEGEEIAPEREG